jgi:hypothetical protein
MKHIGLSVVLLMLVGAANAAVVFSDDFTGLNGSAVDSTKWSTFAMDGAAVAISDNQAHITSNAMWAFGAMTSTTSADFFGPGVTATYTVDVRHGYTLYGQSEVGVGGAGGSLKLHWTTEWPGGAMTYYTLTTTGSNPQTLWSGSRWWDEGQTITIALTPTTYSVSLYDPKTDSVWASPSGSHGLASSDFPNGGYLTLYTLRGNGNDMDDAFDNASIDVVPEPVTLTLLAGGLAMLRRRV